MNSAEIKKNAPDGATCYDAVEKKYYKQNHKDVWMWIGNWLYLSNCKSGDVFVCGMIDIIDHRFD